MKRLEKHEVRQILEAIDGKAKAVVEFIAMTGARVSEALSVRGEDIDPLLGIVRIRTSKNPRHPLRKIKVGAEYARRLADGREPLGRIFSISRQAVGKAMRAAAKRIGIAIDRAHPHAIRHGWAIANAEQGVPAPVLKNLLGHSSLTTVTIYTEEIEAMKWNHTAAM